MIRRWAPLGILLTGLAGVRWVLARVGDVEQTAALSPLTCPIRGVTGLPCPTCGMGRSLVASAGLDLENAFAHHPFGPPLLLAALVLTTGIALGLGPQMQVKTRNWRKHPGARRLLAAGVLVYVGLGLLWNFG